MFIEMVFNSFNDTNVQCWWRKLLPVRESFNGKGRLFLDRDPEIVVLVDGSYGGYHSPLLSSSMPILVLYSFMCLL
uniref:Uncharacterized protein n=1 Tax=Parascaris univalens TaxID=6257 RepID=A0A914ZW46_PARUN